MGGASAVPSGGGAEHAGFTSPLAWWMGGASAVPAPSGGTPGFRSPLAWWVGGAAGFTFVQPEQEAAPPTLGGRHHDVRGRETDLDEWELSRLRDETHEALARWRHPEPEATEPASRETEPASRETEPRRDGTAGAAQRAAVVPSLAAVSPILLPPEIAVEAITGFDLLTLAALLAVADDD